MYIFEFFVIFFQLILFFTYGAFPVSAGVSGAFWLAISPIFIFGTIMIGFVNLVAIFVSPNDKIKKNIFVALIIRVFKV